MTEKKIKRMLSEVPPSFTDAIHESFDIIHRQERRKRKIILGMSALCIIALFYAIIPRFQRQAVNDAIVVSVPSTESVEGTNGSIVAHTKSSIHEGWVLVYPDDIYYHCNPTCNLTHIGAVPLPLETAVELKKQPCYECSSQEGAQ